MKKLFWSLVGFLAMLSFGIAQAAPFLVCDPPDPEEQVAAYMIYQDGVLIATKDAETDGSLKMDLNDIIPGTYEWIIKAVNAWGSSDSSDPYISPSLATKPQAIRMEP